MDDYLAYNRAHWNARTPAHLASAFYDVEGWLAGKDSLREIELALLPADLTGLRILHLQCHFGQDTLSLARRGASVTGVDLSDVAIAAARELAERAGLEARFICCDLYELPDRLQESFDLVFTSYGTIGWLPDLDRWAGVVGKFLRPGGRFVFVEFHPVAWLWNEDRSAVQYSYFGGAPIVEDVEGSYTDNSTHVRGTMVSWDHPVSAVITALLEQGLRLDVFREYDFSPYDCFPDTVRVGEQRWQFRQLPGLIPLTYALVAEG
ncbi:bifunctional 2-polyprenyl-6-hydroxyphenol methylase/3-demethylubiquinol 3-O-methyltransferase UbiG [Lewinella sp. JB7]|uniref:class I SAM-dependent methyltransferase n=1 Tax=Lewinella sp. JB7 TaxID=2962887 RepID=UPI0020C9E9C6|nr:class I SAM-dependent methyltransferase [Lewinella sp. JB7]MCP9236089.1 class I SAM-dependent methyltransferase [Lewinella sp. JB7]